MQDDQQPRPNADAQEPAENVPPPPGARPPLLLRLLLALPTVPWAVLYFLATIVFLGTALGAVLRGQSQVAYGMETGETVWAVVFVALLLFAGALTLAGVGLAALLALRRTILWAVLAIAAAVLTVVAVVVGVRAGSPVGWWLAFGGGFPYAAVLSVIELWLLVRGRRSRVAAP